MSLQRIDRAWAEFFGLPPSDFMRPGVQVVAHRQLADYQGAWLFRHHTSLCVSVPPELVDSTRALVCGGTVESVFGETAIRGLWGPRVERIVGPVYQGYVEPTHFRLAARPGVRALSRGDRAALQQLADACEADAWEHAGIAADEQHVFGCFVDDRLIAAARYRPEWDETAHIGVVTHPAYRGHGHGRAVVSMATAQALDAGFVALYQTLLANAPSVALASRLGYRPYATHLAVRLASPGPAN